MGFVIEIFVEVVLEIFLELMFLIVPERNVSKKHILIAKIMAIVVLLAIIALFVWGMILVVDEGNSLGFVPVSIAVIISLAQIIAGIVLYKRNH